MIDLTALQAALNKEFQEPMSDLIARSNPLLAAMPKRAMSTDRIWLRHKSASNHNPRVITDGTAVTVGDPQSDRKAGVLDWSTYISEFKLPKRLLGQVVGNPAMIGQLFKDEIDDAVADLADKISQDLFAGDVANGLVGLASVFNDSGTYAGINRATGANAYWRGLVVDAAVAAAAGPLSTSLMYLAEKAFFLRNKYELFSPRVSPTTLTSKDVQLMYKELFEQISYDALGSAHFVNQANAGDSFGKSGVGFSGSPILAEPNIGAASGDISGSSRMYILDTNQIFLATLTPNDDPDVVRMQQLDASKAPATDGLNCQIEILGNTGELITGYVKTYIQVVSQAPPRAGVVIKNIVGSFTA